MSTKRASRPPNLPAASKFSAERAKTVLAAFQVGETAHGAAMAAGVDRRTLNNWRQRNPEFDRECVAVESKMRRFCTGKIMSDPSWQSKAWWLERSYPAEFGKRVELSGPGGTPLHSQGASDLERAVLAGDPGARALARQYGDWFTEKVKVALRERTGTSAHVVPEASPSPPACDDAVIVAALPPASADAPVDPGDVPLRQSDLPPPTPLFGGRRREREVVDGTEYF